MSDLIPENIYGHLKRLHWIVSHLKKGDHIVEFGCGTGVMITLPLTKMGFSVVGIDLDEESISLGQKILHQEGLDPKTLIAEDISTLELVPDAIIASEVLEHIKNKDIIRILGAIRQKLKPGGKLLITVPNGYGWFELESFLWFRAGLGSFLRNLQIILIFNIFKRLLLGFNIEVPHPATLSNSPHVQRFTHDSIQKLLTTEGFEVIDITGSVLFAGPFSNMMFTGMKTIMKLNCAFGQRFPKISSGFYVACRLPD